MLQVKFMGQEENTELREKLENLEEDIQDQQVTPDTYCTIIDK